MSLCFLPYKIINHSLYILIIIICDLIFYWRGARARAAVHVCVPRTRTREHDIIDKRSAKPAGRPEGAATSGIAIIREVKLASYEGERARGD